MKVYETVEQNVKARIIEIEEQMLNWKKVMQNPDIQLYEFVKKAKIVIKLDREREILKRF